MGAPSTFGRFSRCSECNPETLPVHDDLEQSKPIATRAVVSHLAETLPVLYCLEQSKPIALGAVDGHRAETLPEVDF